MTQTQRVTSPQLKVQVTRDKINGAVKADSSHCMIAESIEAIYPNAKNISVDIQTIRFSDKEKRLRYTYLTPRIAQLAIVRFDMGSKPEPFQFRLTGAQITAMRGPSQHRPMSEAQKASLERARSLAPSLQKDLKHPTVVPQVVGGKTPPRQRVRDGVPFSRRRQFGLRALERIPQLDTIE